MSGATVLLLVAMWALLLVPMLLRRHDHALEVRSADRFATAMRILSRRGSSSARYAVVVPRRLPPRVDTRLARRRRRLVVGLVVTWVVTLAAAVTASAAFYALHALATAGLVATVVSLRRRAARVTAARRAQLAAERRRALEARRRAAARARRIAPPRPAVVVSRPAVRHIDPPPAEDVPVTRPAAAVGAPWSPVPVPPPTYVSASTAPRLPRVVDLTKPGVWASQQDPARGGGPGWVHADEADGRRAVND